MQPAKGGLEDPALGRSRGGFTTKIHRRFNAHGLAIGAVLSEGEAHDVTAYDELMEQRDSYPRTPPTKAMTATPYARICVIVHHARDPDQAKSQSAVSSVPL